jgi:uncharacterized protein (TIGR02147 family)
MRGFARKVHCSPTLVSQICSGHRNLGETRAEYWLERLGLKDEEAAHFITLVRFAEAPTKRQREEAWQRIVAGQHFRESRPALSVLLKMFEHWLRPVIHEMARLEGFQADPSWVQSRLGPDVPLGVIESSLEWLQAEGLLGPGQDGRMKALQDALTSDQEVGQPALSHILYGMQDDLLSVAADRLPQVPPSQRLYSTITAGVSEAQHDAIRKEIRALEQKMVFIAGGDDGQPRDRVYQLTMQWFPMTRPEDE